jgi:hypothetical protein
MIDGAEKKLWRLQVRIDETTKKSILSLLRPDDENIEARAVMRVIRAGLKVLNGNKVVHQ